MPLVLRNSGITLPPRNPFSLRSLSMTTYLFCNSRSREALCQLESTCAINIQPSISLLVRHDATSILITQRLFGRKPLNFLSRKRFLSKPAKLFPASSFPPLHLTIVPESTSHDTPSVKGLLSHGWLQIHHTIRTHDVIHVWWISSIQAETTIKNGHNTSIHRRQ